MILHSVLQRVHLFHITIHMILHSVTTCSLIPYYHPHDIAFCLYNVFTYSILPSTWYCILCVQRVHLFHITIHMILHSVCTTCSLIPYYHPHDIAFCLYNVFTYSILPSTWYCILFVQRVHLFHITIHMILHSVCTTCVHLFHITIHMILHSVCTTCSLIPYYHPHDIAFCCTKHLFHITIHMILHSVCTRCSRSPHYHPHDIAFCLYVFTYSILPSTWYCILFVHLFHIPSTWYCILFVQRVHLFHITIHMILHSVCTTCSLIPYYHPHDIAFCLYNVFTYSILPSTWYCILFVQLRCHLFHITIHMILHSVCTTCSLIPYYHPHDIAYNVFTYSLLPWYCILFVQRVHLFHITIHMILLLQRVHLFHITIHMILHSVCTTCSLIPYYHPHDIAFCLCVHLVHITIHMILHSVCTRSLSILPSTWYCILCSLIPYYHPHDIAFCVYTCSLIPYYHPHDIAFCVYNVFTYSILPSTWYCILFVQRVHSILPSTWYCILLQRVHLFHITSTWYCILFVQRVHLFHITIHMILHSVFTYSILPSTRYCILFVQHVHLFHITIHMILHSVVFTYSILPSTWYCILFVRVHLFHITIHMILHSVCTTCSLIPYYHPHDIAFCVYNVFTYSILPSTWYCILCVQRVHLFHITIHMILHSVVQRVRLFHITIHMIVHSVCTTCSLPYYHPHDIYNVFTYSILPSTWYCILFVQRVHLFHITIHMILHSVCTTCSLIPYYHPHDIAFCLYNVFTYSILPSTWYCILFVQRVHLFHITIHMILHSVLQRVHLFHITIHMILHFACTTCSLIPYYHPHDIAFCLYNMFTYSILPSTWYCILFVCSLIPHYHPHDIAFCLYAFTYSILPSTWYCILFVQRVHLFHITIHMILHSVCTTCSLIPYYHPHDIAFCVYNVSTYSILPSTW